MWQHFLVNNFRCFAGLHLKDLARVNLIAGKNNTGKTALLEAIHLHDNPANWQLPVDINRARGIREPSRALEDVCAWLFYRGHIPSGLSLESHDEKGVTRTLTMYILDPASARERFPEAEKALASLIGPSLKGSLSRLILKFEQTNEPERISIGVAGEIVGGGHGGIWIDARIPRNIPDVFLTSGGASAMQDVGFFGELEKTKRQQEILPALQIVEPCLQHLSLVPLAGESVIHGDVGLPLLVPVPFMGEGVRRVLSLVLAIANAPGGVVLIDEIENGLHYSVQKKVWQVIAQAARQANVQVFATTHSWECIRWAHEAFSESEEYDFRLFRLDRTDGDVSVSSYDRERIESALFNAVEMR